MFDPILVLFLLLLGVGMADNSHVRPRAAVTARDNYLDHVTFVDMGWTGSIVPGGPNYTFTGTVQEIVDQIQEIDPGKASSQQYLCVSALPCREPCH